MDLFVVINLISRKLTETELNETKTKIKLPGFAFDTPLNSDTLKI